MPYEGPKYKGELIRIERLKEAGLSTLAYWCREFDRLGLAPPYEGGSYGNLSFRTHKNQFIITAARSPLCDANPSNLTHVIDVDMENKIIKFVAENEKMMPSSESMVHHAVYCARPDVNAIFHGHNHTITKYAKKLGIVETEKEEPYGTVELVKSVVNILGNNSFIQMKNHGFVSMGKTMEEAGRLAVSMFNRTKDIK